MGRVLMRARLDDASASFGIRRVARLAMPAVVLIAAAVAVLLPVSAGAVEEAATRSTGAPRLGARFESEILTARARLRPCSAARAAHAASRSTQQPARSTGPISTLAASEWRTWTARARLDVVRRSELPLRRRDRSRGGQDLLGRLRIQPDQGRQPRWFGVGDDPVRGAGGKRVPAEWRSTLRTARSTGRTSSPTKSGLGPWAGRVRPRLEPCSVRPTPATTRSASRSPGARSTGPRSTRGRSGTETQMAQVPRPSSVASAVPGALAVDPGAGKIYWANFYSGTVRVGSLDGSGTASTLFSGEAGPSFPALLRAPLGSGVPTISGGGDVGQTLTCSQGSWAPDLLGAFLFRAPRTLDYQWLTGDSEIPGANAGHSRRPSLARTAAE